jgi:TatD DNase family protein
MIDSHCHLSYAPLFDQIDQVLARAAAVGVKEMITIATKPSEVARSFELKERFPQIHCAIGIHPHYAGEASAQEISEICRLFADPKACACGEMGLDYHYDFSPRDAQQKVFETQLAAAIPTGKPLVLHCREAIDESLAILRSQPHHPAVFHCFTGTADEARRILSAGYYLGITGVVTFKNTQYLRDIVSFIPADRLLLETDAPYLAPEPLRRQKVNEPSLVAHTFKRVAEIRGVPLQALIDETTRNVHQLFNI